MKLRPLSALLREHKQKYLFKQIKGTIKNINETKSKAEIDKFIASFLKDYAKELEISDRHRNWLYIRGIVHGILIAFVLVPIVLLIIKYLS